MKKRFLAVFLALALCVGLAPTVFAGGGGGTYVDYPVVGGNLRFGSDGASWYLSHCDASVTVADIPSTIDGIPVTSIEVGAFSRCTSLTSVTIPDSVTGIGGSAFSRCTSLTSVTIPDSVTSIGGSAFSGCTSLTSVTIPDSVTSIGDWAFYGCTSLTSVTIPTSVTSVGKDAFYGTPWLGENQEEFFIVNGILLKYQGDGGNVTIPSSVTSIGSGAFFGCESPTSVTIPTSVTSIGSGAFLGCESLASISLDSGNSNYTVVGGVLFSKDMTLLHTYPYEKQGSSYSIPTSVTSIGEHAFEYCESLTSVTIPDSVTNIGDHAFFGCSGLTSMTIPTSVTSIGERAFVYCESLTSVTIPNSVTSIERSAFEGCDTDVYYGGSEQQWNQAQIGDRIATSKNATIHYNSVIAKFPDLKPNGFYVDAVEWALSSNITTGKTAASFAPNENCTHGQILTFLWRAAGEPASNVPLPFATTGNEYYLGAAKWAYEKGMIGADFNHKTPCTRADAVNYIWQAFGKGAASYDRRFTDVPANSPYATAVAWALEKGVTTGTTATTFTPNKICNRGEIVTFLYRAYVPSAR